MVQTSRDVRAWLVIPVKCSLACVAAGPSRAERVYIHIIRYEWRWYDDGRDKVVCVVASERI